MALINCLECGQEISDKAATCPKCGAPIVAASQTTVAVPEEPTTIQLTSKNLKGQIALSTIMILIGGVWFFAAAGNHGDPTFPSVILFVGLIWRLVTGIRIWWHHE